MKPATELFIQTDIDKLDFIGIYFPIEVRPPEFVACLKSIEEEKRYPIVFKREKPKIITNVEGIYCRDEFDKKERKEFLLS